VQKIAGHSVCLNLRQSCSIAEVDRPAMLRTIIVNEPEMPRPRRADSDRPKS